MHFYLSHQSRFPPITRTCLIAIFIIYLFSQTQAVNDEIFILFSAMPCEMSRTFTVVVSKSLNCLNYVNLSGMYVYIVMLRLELNIFHAESNTSLISRH